MKKLVIVEDDIMTQQLYVAWFKKIGVKPLITDCGDELFHEISSDDMGAIIMDINLTNTYFKGEKVDGIKLSRMIKCDEKLKNIPIILATGYTITSRDQRLMKESLAEDLVTKPILNINVFLDKINSYLLN